MQQPLIRAGGCRVWAVLWWAAFTHDGRYALAGVPKLPNQLA
ncbi:hypothetical protein PA05_1751 [Cutibacterium acnes P05]|jgi:hypothetical protein|nr:hypothetical protein [Cutibacterium acnes P05]